MSHDPLPPTDDGLPETQWQARLATLASGLPYPPTPNLAAGWGADWRAARATGRAQRPAWAWALAALIVPLSLAAALLAVPAVRAGLLDFLQIGSVRIQFVPSPAPSLAPAATVPAVVGNATSTPRPTATPTSTPLPSVLDLAGQTSYADAQARVRFNLGLPAYPPDLGPPALAYVQDLGGPAVILVWLAPGHPDRVRLSLHYLTNSAMVDKMLDQNGTPASVQTTSVNHFLALWTSGPYIVVTRQGDYGQRRLINGHVLIWTHANLTYRLETDLPMAEAVRVAESIKP